MNFAYYPGCSLTGSAKKLDRGVRRLCAGLGHTLTEIPDWNCCGALEYGDRNELLAISGENLTKAPSRDILSPCPACYKNLKDAAAEEGHGDDPAPFRIVNPLELLTGDVLSRIQAKRDLKGKIFTAYYGCLLLRPEATAIGNKTVMEDVITTFGGEVEGQKVRDRCCGGNQLFVNKWATEKLSRLITEKSRGTIVVFCPFCHMAMKTFSTGRKVIYVTDLLLYVMGESSGL